MDGTHCGTAELARFWTFADELQERTIDHAGNLFTFAETAPAKQLLSLLIQYRFFTIYYIPDIAILVARLRDGKLRSFLADILSDELGCGDPSRAHPRLYDDFLKSIGADDQDLDSLAIRDNIGLLESVRRKLIDPSVSTTYGVGLRGMGGECVCQIYLSRFYEHITKNEFIRQRKSRIDWQFWDLHVGEHDIAHRLKTRQLIQEEILSQGPDALEDLGQGYCESMASWSAFWANIFDSVQGARVERTRIRKAVNFQLAASAEHPLGEARYG
jgi:Iron-containing redox enzyme